MDIKSDIFHAVKSDDEVAALAIVEKLDNIETRDSHRMTPLMWAIVFGMSELFNRLLDMGADVNVVEDTGKSCLWLAENFNRNEMRKKLLLLVDRD